MLREKIGKHMTQLERLKFAFVSCVIFVLLVSTIDMIFHIDIGGIIFSPVFAIPVLVIAYIVAPLIGKYIKMK